MFWYEVRITEREAEPMQVTTIRTLGPQDPELRNSPVIGEMDEDREFPRQNVPNPAGCYFNGQAFDSILVQALWARH